MLIGINANMKKVTLQNMVWMSEKMRGIVTSL